MQTALVQIQDIDAAHVPALIATGTLEPAEVGRQLMSLPSAIVAEVLTGMPVMMAAAVCRDSVGCGDEMVLLSSLPVDTATDVMFTDLVLFAGVGDLHAFKRLALDGMSKGEYDGEVADRTLEVTNVRGEAVRVAFALDPERAKLYVTTIFSLEESHRDRLIDSIGGEEAFVSFCAFVVSVMMDCDYDWDEAWIQSLAEHGILVPAMSLSRRVDRIALEHELLEPHVGKMEQHFAPVQEVFAEYEGTSTEDLLAGLVL